MGENIGASARAMLNCGLVDLRLVTPRDGWPSERARAMSSGALDKMPPVEVFKTLSDAIAGCHHVYATTARPRDMNKPMMSAREAATHCHSRAAQGQRTAFVFGGERAGLSNEDVALCHTIITIPLNPDFSSLNLAQCVLLCTYEWSQIDPPPSQESENLPAPHKDLNFLFERLETELAQHGFFKTQEMRPNVMRNIQTMLNRAELTAQDVQTFHGMITALIERKNGPDGS